MKVAIICPSFGQTGGPELTTTQLADALTEKGVDVSLFAPNNFITKARLIPTLEHDLWNRGDLQDMTEYEKKNLFIASQVKILSQQDTYDLIHISSQKYAYAVASNLHKPCALTLHNRMKTRDYALLKKTGVYTIALTKKYKGEIDASAAIYPGLPLETITPSYEAGSGLITIGRITDQKGIHLSIEIARKAKKKLLIVGRIGKSEERVEYFNKKVLPFIDNDLIRFRESVNYDELLPLIAKSEALLFPIIRPETFGRVAAEALACGTPVIGTTTEPLPEILSDKRVSTLSDDVDTLVNAARHIEQFDRELCRKYVEEKFDIRKTAEKHIQLYERVLQKS